MAAVAGELEDPWTIHPSIHLSVREIDILLGGVKNTEVVNNLHSSPSVPTVHLLELNSLAGRGRGRTNSEGACRWQ